jgi:hypothetical protein
MDRRDLGEKRCLVQSNPLPRMVVYHGEGWREQDDHSKSVQMTGALLDGQKALNRPNGEQWGIAEYRKSLD